MTINQHAKNQAILSFCFRDTVNFKILHSDWLGVFWPISQEPEFSQTLDLYRNISNNINFHYIPNAEKIMTKIFNNFKTPCFGDILGVKKISQKIQLCHAQLHKGFQHNPKIYTKLMTQL